MGGLGGLGTVGVGMMQRWSANDGGAPLHHFAALTIALHAALPQLPCALVRRAASSGAAHSSSWGLRWWWRPPSLQMRHLPVQIAMGLVILTTLEATRLVVMAFPDRLTPPRL